MACRLFGAKPLPEPVLTYCQLDLWQQISVKFELKYKTFHSWKGICLAFSYMQAQFQRQIGIDWCSICQYSYLGFFFFASFQIEMIWTCNFDYEIFFYVK